MMNVLFRTNGISDVTYSFKVTSLSPDFGSLYGGTDLLIVGKGFNTDTSLMSVALGPHACDISSATSTEIRCRIADTGTRHTISATGRHVSKLCVRCCFWRILLFFKIKKNQIIC